MTITMARPTFEVRSADRQIEVEAFDLAEAAGLGAALLQIGVETLLEPVGLWVRTKGSAEWLPQWVTVRIRHQAEPFVPGEFCEVRVRDSEDPENPHPDLWRPAIYKSQNAIDMGWLWEIPGLELAGAFEVIAFRKIADSVSSGGATRARSSSHSPLSAPPGEPSIELRGSSGALYHPPDLASRPATTSEPTLSTAPDEPHAVGRARGE